MPEFRILGPLEATHSGQPLTPTPPKIRSVLALLLLRANRIVSVESLIEELWGPEPPRSAVTTVQTYIYHLRRLFAAGGLGTEDEPLITTRPAGYQIATGAGEVDAVVFEELLSRGRDALEDGSMPEAAELLRTALDLWTGPALADVPQGSLLQAHAVHLDELRISAMELRIRADLKLGRHHSLIAELRSLTHEHPLNEWFHGQLISALNRSGRRGEALQAYQDVRQVLSDELGVDPSPALQKLQRQVLSVGAG